MGLEHIVGETQVSRRNLFRLGALGLGTYLVSQVPAFGQDAQVARNNNTPATNGAQPTVSFEDLRTQGDRYLQAHQYPQAIDTYTQALSVQGHENDSAILNQRGAARSDSGDYQGAITDYEHSLRYNSINSIVRKNLGLTQYRVGRDQRNQDLATNAVHNLYMAKELAYAQLIVLNSYDEDLQGVQRRARTDFPNLDTSEPARGMTRAERFRSAQELRNDNKPAALYLYRRVVAENATDEMGQRAASRIPHLENYLRQHGLNEIAMR